MGLRDDKLWDDLLWQLKHPLTPDQEERKRKAEESFIERKLNKVFGGSPTGGAAPIKGYVRYDKNPYEEIQKDKTLSTDEKVKRIKAISEAEKKKIDQEHALKMAKLYGGAGLEIGSAAIPGMGSTKAVTTVAKALAPKVGRKIATEIATGVVRGGVSGAVEGLGKGMLEDKNPIKTAAQDAFTGASLGPVGGLVAGNVQKGIRGAKLQKIEDLKTLRKAETSFYKDYNQLIPVTRKDLGKIDFTQAGLETVSKAPEAGRSFINLQKDIKNADYIGYELPRHKKHGSKDNIKGFHKLKNDNQEFLIADTDDGLKYYMSKNIGTPSIRPSRVEPNVPSSIIPHSDKPFNPALDIFEWVKRRRGLK